MKKKKYISARLQKAILWLYIDITVQLAKIKTLFYIDQTLLGRIQSLEAS